MNVEINTVEFRHDENLEMRSTCGGLQFLRRGGLHVEPQDKTYKQGSILWESDSLHGSELSEATRLLSWPRCRRDRWLAIACITYASLAKTGSSSRVICTTMAEIAGRSIYFSCICITFEAQSGLSKIRFSCHTLSMDQPGCVSNKR